MKKKKVKSFKQDTVPETKMVMRMVTVREDTADPEKKSVEVVVASENPVARFDEESGEVVDEILSMAGVQFRANRNKLPIVDSHDRSTVRNVLGSVRNLRVEGTELVGDATFARDTDSQVAFEKLLDGHLDDFSITATPTEVERIDRGKTIELNGAHIQGPAEVVTGWIPTDASLVAAGADETSTVRRSYTHLERNSAMDDSLRKKLVEKGMPEDIENEAEALAWAIGRFGDDEEEEEEEREEKAEREEETPEPAERADVSEEIKRALDEDRKRQNEIRALCTRANLEREYADELCNEGVSLDDARAKVLEKIVSREKPVGSKDVTIEFKASSDDKFRAAVRDGMIQRASGAIGKTVENTAQGSEDFRNLSLLRTAEQVLRKGGLDTGRMSEREIAMVALGHRSTIERLRSSGIMRDGAYHTTGSFSNLMLDAANKTLLDGYQEAMFTWSIWARQAPSVTDFKDIHRIRFSESPDVQMVPQTKPYNEGSMSDQKETYNVEKFGRIFSVSWETIVNDDLDALSRVPQMHGNAARRTQNKKVYAVLTDNDNMSDGNSLFDSSNHSNDASSTGAPSVTTLNSAFESMRTQTGLEGEIIGVMPRYLIVPAALEATGLELFTSTGRPDVGGSSEGNSGVQNIYGPGGRRSVELVAEPQLDGNSTTAWFMAADNASVDTVELSFLQGEESPVLESEWDFDRDILKYKVRQTFGVAAVDWRGLYRNTG